MKIIFSVLLISTLFIISLSGQLTGNSVYSEPDRIMLTIPGDPSTTAAVSWRTNYSDTASIGQIAVAMAAPNPEKEAKKVNGIHSPWEKESKAGMGHKVVFTGLKPETMYTYRVGNGEQWSEWFQFTTASDKAKPFSFIYIGDVQNDILSQGSRILRQAYSHFPDAGFILYAGDIVDRSTDERWAELFKAAGWIFGTMPSVPTPGNHEYNSIPNSTARNFSSHWQQIFTMPKNGPSPKFDSRAYYIDYQGVRFISFDSPATGYTKEDSSVLVSWLDKSLASNTNKWTIVFTHYPVYNCSQGRNNERYRNSVQPLLEKYGVDLMLQGHDHTYCRGMNMSGAGTNAKNYPVYVVSVSGTKMYGLNSSLWADRVASETQLYQNISIDSDLLTYKSFTVNGELYDAFQIKKNKKGVNKFIEAPEIKEKPERLTIPESQKSKYKPEEIQKIETRMKGK
jgi:hypothetical protein